MNQTEASDSQGKGNYNVSQVLQEKKKCMHFKKHKSDANIQKILKK